MLSRTFWHGPALFVDSDGNDLESYAMEQHAVDDLDVSFESLPRVAIPPARSATSEELARRRAAIARILELRERIGPIGIAADDLIHEARRVDEG